mmetsp:Transcript_8708/g.14462  ORF Transcript_8708/g.14462 Transcript_8708/m.14462 type:complete len:146 (-) Transcript_8708:52-489(-)
MRTSTVAAAAAAAAKTPAQTGVKAHNQKKQTTAGMITKNKGEEEEEVTAAGDSFFMEEAPEGDVNPNSSSNNAYKNIKTQSFRYLGSTRGFEEQNKRIGGSGYQNAKEYGNREMREERRMAATKRKLNQHNSTHKVHRRKKQYQN